MSDNKGYLTDNLSYIKKYNKQIEASLNIEIHVEDFELENSWSGHPVLYYKDLALNNKYDPMKQANHLLAQIIDKDNENAIHVLIGIGTGYDFRVFAQNLKGKLILLELSPEILAVALDLIDFSDELALQNVVVATNSNEAIEAIAAFYQSNCNITFSSIDTYNKIAPNLISDLKKIVDSLIPEKYEGGPLKLNIGPGRWYKKGWKRLDCYTNFTNFNIDLREMIHLPLENDVLEKVFSSHCIEHIEDSHLDVLIKELYRCMQPGGILRLSCPDADQAIDAYITKNTKWFEWLPPNTMEKMLINTFVSYDKGGPDLPDELIKEKFETLEKEAFIRWCVSQADRTRPYIAHINGHYFDKLYKKLSDAGFVNINRSTYRGSEDKELRGELFDLHSGFSVYVECRKPGRIPKKKIKKA